MQAASYPQVERVFVNPAIKKKLCDTWTGDRTLLGKLRPDYGHDSHFHIRMKCPPGAAGCKPQAPVAAGDGCDKSLAWWFTKEPWAPPKPPKPGAKPAKPPREVMVSDLPKACAAVLAAPAVGLGAVPRPMAAPRLRKRTHGRSGGRACGRYRRALPAVGPVPARQALRCNERRQRLCAFKSQALGIEAVKSIELFGTEVFFMASGKCLALIAHDQKKDDMADFARAQQRPVLPTGRSSPPARPAAACRTPFPTSTSRA